MYSCVCEKDARVCLDFATGHPQAMGGRHAERRRRPSLWEMNSPLKDASSLFCVGSLNRVCYLCSTSVTEPPPGRPSGAAACIAYGGVGADSPHKMFPVYKSYPHQIANSPVKDYSCAFVCCQKRIPLLDRRILLPYFACCQTILP